MTENITASAPIKSNNTVLSPSVQECIEFDAPKQVLPQEYTIDNCIKKYGASRYLQNLRQRFKAGYYTHNAFVSLSARAYLAAGLPRRSLALIRSFCTLYPSVEHTFATQIADAENSIRKTHCFCSLNMIVKNEEANIGSALASIDDCVDEIILCDTGSTDKTCLVAQEFGVTVVFDPWENDFSKARNKALMSSSGQWILWMDADDKLEEKSRSTLTSLIRSSLPHAAGIRIVNIQNNIRGAEFMQVRLFPRLDSIQFEYRIHEQIMPSLQKQDVPYEPHPDIEITHSGYNNEALAIKKAQRNKPILIEELVRNRNNPALLLSLGDCYATLGEVSNSYTIYSKITKHLSNKETSFDVFVQAHFNMATLQLSTNNFTEAQSLFTKTIELDPFRVEAYYALGLMAEKAQNYKQALSYFLQSSTNKIPLRLTAIDFQKIRIESVYHICKIYFDKELFKECETVLISSIEIFPTVVEFHTLLGKASLCLKKLPQAAKSFMTSLKLCPKNNFESYRGMSDIYTLVGNTEKANKFLSLCS